MSEEEKTSGGPILAVVVVGLIGLLLLAAVGFLFFGVSMNTSAVRVAAPVVAPPAPAPAPTPATP